MRQWSKKRFASMLKNVKSILKVSPFLMIVVIARLIYSFLNCKIIYKNAPPPLLPTQLIIFEFNQKFFFWLRFSCLWNRIRLKIKKKNWLLIFIESFFGYFLRTHFSIFNTDDYFGFNIKNREEKIGPNHFEFLMKNNTLLI